jgi:hypothetical protein
MTLNSITRAKDNERFSIGDSIGVYPKNSKKPVKVEITRIVSSPTIRGGIGLLYKRGTAAGCVSLKVAKN